MTGHDSHTNLTCEYLEDRDTPAGNVTAMLSGGALIVTGDDAFNRVRIEQDGAGNLSVIGLAGTTVNGQSAVYIGQGIPSGVFVDLGNGQDYLEMVGVYAGTINVQGGNDGDGLYLWNVGASGNIEVHSGEANDTLFASGVVAGGALVLDGGNAYDIIHVDNSWGNGGTFFVNNEAPF
ncbi:hypothetical protein VT84_15425 [Gemmata sp. SH-PL17]|uniref:hypothetical protein n=1 Tax=Gemmata sp. SH-PL17 TaxID=1630693 RepID=UPI00078DBEDF|nr:hypothetical protein [Gemmata sp. SH-PL17]AMV25787.1 hypothetical protein VT84_15425 [Gemmata sp. SH-PL17]